MDGLKVGDIVARRSYGCDIFFKVANIEYKGDEVIATLKGISYRIEADAPESDLIVQPEQKVWEYKERTLRAAESRSRDVYASHYRGYPKKTYYRSTSKEETGRIRKPGKVLHLDGDNDYLETCLSEYRANGITATGCFVPEKDQPESVYGLLQEYRPDILVLTGHDGLLKGSESYNNLGNYRNSRYFIEAVRESRRFNNDMDGLVIFAGACQSFFFEIIKAGANFASAPYRDLIHALDPVRVCQKVAFTSIEKVLHAEEVIDSTITGKSGIGGVQTRGKYREGYPTEPY